MLSGEKMEKWREKWSFLEGKQLFIACSGGVDSMVLLHLVRELKTNLTVLHVNYGLRAEASDLDEKLVVSYCREHKINCQVQHIDMHSLLENGGNLQAIARETRYAWFETFLNNENTLLALAHHQDDQLENFFLNLARKSGILGMANMLEIHGNKIRPLLDFSKAEIYAFAIENSIPWREDESNAESKYRRNKLRNHILPELYGEIPSLQDAVLTLISHFQEEQNRIEKSVREIIIQIKETKSWSLNQYNSLPAEEKIEILRQLGFPASILTELDKLQMSERGKFISYSEKKWLKEETTFSFIDSEIESSIPNFTIEKCDYFPTSFNKNELYLDASLIKGNLQIRKWQKDDLIYPIGIQGKQKLYSILKDAKLTIFEKSNVFVLHDKQTIHWLIGIKIGRKAIANSDSKEIIKITIN